MAERTVTLAPGESKLVSFEVTPTMAKTYSVSVDGLSGSFRATEAPVEVIDFDLTRPTVTPETITPGTDISITCPITSACTNLQTITAKVIIYEGSILPGHGAVIATKTSPSFSISPGEAYNVIVHHTAVAGTIDRRDIEVEVYIAGTLVKQSEWDDVYYVEKPVVPEVVIEFYTDYEWWQPALTVFDVEGIPFVSVGTETTLDWVAVGLCLNNYGPALYWEGWITAEAGPAIAECMRITYGVATADALYGCLDAHPEWSTENYKRYYGMNACEIMMLPCGAAAAPYTGLVATLAEPIEMDKIRGVSLTVMGGGLMGHFIANWGDKIYSWNFLWYKPTFSAPMPAPGFAGRPGGTIGDHVTYENGHPVAIEFINKYTISAKQCYAGGYYYPGIYDGEFEVGWFPSSLRWGEPVEGYRFMIKNLARVTGKGTVVP